MFSPFARKALGTRASLFCVTNNPYRLQAVEISTESNETFGNSEKSYLHSIYVVINFANEKT